MTSAIWSTRPSREVWPSRRRGEQRRNRRTGRSDHGADGGKFCCDVRDQRSRRGPEHEARSTRHAGPRSSSIISTSPRPMGTRARRSPPIYVGAKHAVEGITKSVALEIAKSGIRVNAVAPGPTDTGMLTRFTGTVKNKARAGDAGSGGSARTLRRGRRRHRLHRLGRSQVHHRSRPQRRWRSTARTGSYRAPRSMVRPMRARPCRRDLRRNWTI